VWWDGFLITCLLLVTSLRRVPLFGLILRRLSLYLDACFQLTRLREPRVLQGFLTSVVRWTKRYKPRFRSHCMKDVYDLDFKRTVFQNITFRLPVHCGS
jgi:hypothetical protein